MTINFLKPGENRRGAGAVRVKEVASCLGAAAALALLQDVTLDTLD